MEELETVEVVTVPTVEVDTELVVGFAVMGTNDVE